MSPLSFERLHERGRALGQWERDGGNVVRLLALDVAVRQGHLTDWPDRSAGWPEVRWNPGRGEARIRPRD